MCAATNSPNFFLASSPSGTVTKISEDSLSRSSFEIGTITQADVKSSQSVSLPIPDSCYRAGNNNTLVSNTKQHRGSLVVRVGPMFSGKSTWLNGELTRLADQGFKVLKVRHVDDIRSDVHASDSAGSTHNSSYRGLSSKITCVDCKDLRTLDVREYHVIGIDESQWYTDLVAPIINFVEDQGKHLKVVGLDGDSNRRPFGETLQLIPYCDEIVKLTATCRICLDELAEANFHGNILGLEAPFTKSIVAQAEQKCVGGSDRYIATCRYHHSIVQPMRSSK